MKYGTEQYMYIIFYSLLSVGKDNIFIYLRCELFIYKLYGFIVFTTTSVNDAMYIQTTFCRILVAH
jgi:hypothetical protein